MEKYEYCFVVEQDKPIEIVMKEISEMGGRGWKVIPYDHNLLAFKKNPGILMERKISERKESEISCS